MEGWREGGREGGREGMYGWREGEKGCMDGTNTHTHLSLWLLAFLLLAQALLYTLIASLLALHAPLILKRTFNVTRNSSKIAL